MEQLPKGRQEKLVLTAKNAEDAKEHSLRGLRPLFLSSLRVAPATRQSPAFCTLLKEISASLARLAMTGCGRTPVKAPSIYTRVRGTSKSGPTKSGVVWRN